jgi:hypothetical protein
MKVVINTCHGGFGLSHAAVLAYAKRKGITLYPEKGAYSNIENYTYYTYYTVPPEKRVPSLPEPWLSNSLEVRKAHIAAVAKETLYYRDIPRNDPDLVAVVEEMGNAAGAEFAELKVVDIPDDVQFEIAEYDGLEWVAEKHRTWR